MATYGGWGWDESFTANSDLSAKQYFTVTTGSIAGEVKTGTGGSGPAILGVLQNDPTQGEEAAVRIFGITKAEASGALHSAGTATAIAYGDFVTATGSDGRLRPLVAASAIMNGIALEALASGAGGRIKVLLFGPGLVTGADNVP